MASGKPDRVDCSLLRPALDELIDTRFEELGNTSCCDLLNELLQEESQGVVETS